MRALAALIMRGRLPAAGVLGLTTLVPFLGWVGTAALALVTLRRGPAEGLLVAGLGAALAAVLMAGALGTPAPLLVLVAQFWLPALVLALVLRATVSLGRTLEAASVLAGALVVATHLLLDAPAEFWSRVLMAVMESLYGQPPGPELQAVIEGSVAPAMTGIWAMNLLLVALASLLLARWWQALLYNPGGFGEEFRALRLSPWLAGLNLAVAIGSLAVPLGMLPDLTTAMGAVFAMQALAVAHWLTHRRRLGRAWLVVIYLLAPFLLRLLALVGMVDVFLDLRRRMDAASGDGGGGPA